MTAPNQAQQQPDSQQQNPRQQSVKQQDSHQLAWLAAWLVLHHQAEQRAIAADVVTRLAPLWKILDFNDLKNTQTPWIQAALPIVEDAYKTSQWAAQQFLVDYRHANMPAATDLPAISGTPVGPTARTAVAPQVIEDTAFQAVPSAVSLLGTGPGEVKKQMPAPQEQAMDAGRVLSSKVAIRITIDGGRAVVRRGVELDHEAIGWARVLNADPCSFCAILASRGAVYKRNSFEVSEKQFEGVGVAKVHDGCRCGMRPVYAESERWDPTAQNLLDQWYSHTDPNMDRREAMNAFRRNFTPPPDPAVPQVDIHSMLVTRQQLIDDGFAANSTQVAWMDQQIARFGALVNTDPDAPIARRRQPRAVKNSPKVPTAPSKTESAADVARRQLPALEKTLDELLARGFSAGSPEVQWNRKQIARFQAALR